MARWDLGTDHRARVSVPLNPLDVELPPEECMHEKPNPGKRDNLHQQCAVDGRWTDG